MTYHCPNCGKEVGFGESICPNCKSDVTSMWEQVTSPKKSTPKVTPGLGGMDGNQASPFPAPSSNTNSPFPPPASSNPTPFPSPSGMASSPFPSAPAPSDSPFPSAPSAPAPSAPAPSDSPFPPAPSVSDGPAPFPPVQESQPFPLATAPAGPFLDIPRIGGKLYITENPLRIGRDEIQGVAKKALPDLNAYKNISRKRADSEHFIIHTVGNQYTIEDIHSTNGTYLGTTKLGLGVPPQPLKNGDKIIIPIEEYGKMVQLEVFFKLQ